MMANFPSSMSVLSHNSVSPTKYGYFSEAQYVISGILFRIVRQLRRMGRDFTIVSKYWPESMLWEAKHFAQLRAPFSLTRIPDLFSPFFMSMG